MIPAAPLDGGRLLRAVIWWRTGDRVKATVWASRAGQVFGTICILFFLTLDWSWLWISLIGWFLTRAATAEAQQAVLAGRLRGIRASQPGPKDQRGHRGGEHPPPALHHQHVSPPPISSGYVTVNHAGLNMPALLPIAWLPRALDNVTVITDD